MNIIDSKVKLSENKIIKLEISTFSITRYVLHFNTHNIILFYEETIIDIVIIVSDYLCLKLCVKL